jgi:restriction endonuclease S subunit
MLNFDTIKYLSNSQIGDSLNKTTLGKIKIPILPLEHQQRIVDFMDKTFGTDHKKLDKIVSKFKQYDLFKLLITEDYNGFEELLDLYEDIIVEEKILNKYITVFKNRKIKACFKMVKSEKKKLGDLVETQRGKSLPKNKVINGEYPVISGCSSILNYHNEYNYDGSNSIFMARVGSAGEVQLYNGKCYMTDLTVAFIPKQNILLKYLFNYLKYNFDIIKQYRASNAAPNINMTTLCNKLFIPVPSLSDQLKVVNMIEEINKEESEFNKSINNLKNIINELYQQVKFIVSDSEVNEEEQEVEETYKEEEYQEELEEQYQEVELEECDEQEEEREEEQEEVEEYPYQEKLDEIVNLSEQIKEIEEKIKTTKATVTKNKLETQKKQLQNKVKVIQKEYE